MFQVQTIIKFMQNIKKFRKASIQFPIGSHSVFAHVLCVCLSARQNNNLLSRLRRFVGSNKQNLDDDDDDDDGKGIMSLFWLHYVMNTAEFYVYKIVSEKHVFGCCVSVLCATRVRMACTLPLFGCKHILGRSKWRRLTEKKLWIFASNRGADESFRHSAININTKRPLEPCAL